MSDYNDGEQLRDIRVPLPSGTYRLKTWDTGRLHPRGTWWLGYAFYSPDDHEKPLFAGETSNPPDCCTDSDEVLVAVLNFICNEPVGDVELNERQQDFVDGEAEDLGNLVYEHRYHENGNARDEIAPFHDWDR